MDHQVTWAYRPSKFVHIYQMQTTATSITYVIAKYMPETIMPSNWAYTSYVPNT